VQHLVGAAQALTVRQVQIDGLREVWYLCAQVVARYPVLAIIRTLQPGADRFKCTALCHSFPLIAVSDQPSAPLGQP